jgi:hypothetical protein
VLRVASLVGLTAVLRAEMRVAWKVGMSAVMKDV